MAFSQAGRSALVASICCLAAVGLPASDPGGPRYSISVKGPIAEFQVSCHDPCHIDRVETVGEIDASMDWQDKVEAPESAGRESRLRCFGDDCESDRIQDSRMLLTPPRTLREGVEVSIQDNKAQFTFYVVSETQQGQATVKRLSSFKIDRPLISVELQGHDVIVRTEAGVQE